MFTRQSHGRRWSLPCISLGVVLLQTLSAQAPPLVVISQIYGGGGNAGATLRNDFVELFNRGERPVSLDGWTVQYASATGTTWDRTALTGTLQPGQYYLVQEDAGTGGSAALPTADVAGGINLSATSGKVSLVSNSNVLSGATPTGSQVVDFVGYGSANAAEGGTAGALTNTTAAKRNGGGCTDTGNNRADFSTGTAAPRNSRSPLTPCTQGSGPTVSPQITSAGVANAASNLGGPVAPGEVVTIYGSGLGPTSLVTMQLADDGQHVRTALGGTRVLFDGVAAPMVYASAGQVSAIVPYATAARSTTSLQVEYDGRTSAAVLVPVAPTVPAIFTLDSSGSGPGAIQNHDYSVNGASHPALKGSVVMIFGTGAGTTTPASEDGRLAPSAAQQAQKVTVRIGGADAEVLYAGAAPGLVNGVFQVNAKVPDSIAGGAVSIVVTVGDAVSQPGVTLAVAGETATADGTGPLIDARLQQLKTDPAAFPPAEVPDDYHGVPSDWLAVLSWNTQTGGTSAETGAPRPPMVQRVLRTAFGGTYQILAAQEVPNVESATLLRNLLPGGETTWQAAFFDSTDTMDNGLWYRTGITLRDAFPLFTTGTDTVGRFVPDATRTTHPPVVAQFEVGDFDFTLITVHLQFAEGDTSATAREMSSVLDYLDWYFSQPDHDPDVIVCGDFNLPSALSGSAAPHTVTLDAIFDQDPRFQRGERRFAVTVHEATSRKSVANGGLPANNYDHCVLSADTMEEVVQAHRLAPSVLTDDPDDPEVRLTSDHFPIVTFFHTRGDGVVLDHKRTLRPPGRP